MNTFENHSKDRPASGLDLTILSILIDSLSKKLEKTPIEFRSIN